MLAASRHLCPYLLILLQGSKEHWGQSPPYGKFLATPLEKTFTSESWYGKFLLRYIRKKTRFCLSDIVV
jgi:hypothetical protein